MPLYEFKRADNVLEPDAPEEIKLIYFSFEAVPSIGSSIYLQDGKWTRIASLTNNRVDAKIDPFSEKEFVEKTGKKKGTINDLWETSKELSKQREAILGSDPVLEKFHNDYESKYKMEHPDKKLKKANKNLDKLGVTIKR
jgi:hypothetical protein